jgi:hypothetical protein
VAEINTHVVTVKYLNGQQATFRTIERPGITSTAAVLVTAEGVRKIVPLAGVKEIEVKEPKALADEAAAKVRKEEQFQRPSKTFGKLGKQKPG